MQLKGLVLGEVRKIVRNGNTLKAMARRGFFKFPVDDTQNPYVDEGSNSRTFSYKNNLYRIEYMSGCFYPFVITA